MFPYYAVSAGVTDGSTQVTGLDNFRMESIAVFAGDADGDDDVDGADFLIWQRNFPTSTGATWNTGDADGDADVDGVDFLIWQANFGFGLATAEMPTRGIDDATEQAHTSLSTSLDDSPSPFEQDRDANDLLAVDSVFCSFATRHLQTPTKSMSGKLSGRYSGLINGATDAMPTSLNESWTLNALQNRRR